MSRTVKMDRADLDVFCRSWPCHNIPASCESITFEFADNGDLVDVIAKARNGRTLKSEDFDGPALVALSQDAAEREPETPVIFRKMDGDVLAVFPTDAASYDPALCGCYAHVGQHSACDPLHVVAHSRAATEEEYADLKRELESAPYGYRLRVYKRLQREWYDVRKAALRCDGAKLPLNEPCRSNAVGRLCHET